MNKKVMAAAVAGVLAAPGLALAQTSTVQIGGSITAFYYSHSPNNAGTGQRTDIMETSEPELYVRGEEKLGGGLSTWFQCTSSIDGLINGAAAASAAGWCGRNSGIGFKGSWGNVFFGNWDMPQKLIDNMGRGWWGGTNSLTGGALVLLAGGSASGAANPIRTTAGLLTATAVPGVTSTITNNPGTFFRRQANSLNYHSPSWNGFTFQGAFSAGNEQTGIPETSTLSPRLFSLAGQYRSGPLALGIGYESHSDYNPANVAIGTTAATYSGGTDTRWVLAGGYTFAGVFNLRGMYMQMDFDTTNSTGLDVDGWGLFADWSIQGPHTLRAQYIKVDDTGGTSAVSVGSYVGSAAGAVCGVTGTANCATSTGAKQWGLAYSYAFSKRTMASLVYTKMDNDSNARFSRGKVTASLGNSQSSTGIALQHRF